MLAGCKARPLTELADPEVDSLLKQFAQSSQLGANAAWIEDLYELACWLRSARVYIGNDSGIAHLAAAVGTPVIALFGPTDPDVWAPRGSRVLRPLESIKPADVIGAFPV